MLKNCGYKQINKHILLEGETIFEHLVLES